MFYAWDITIPANTLDAVPASYRLNITRGVITNITVKYPAGCHGLVKVRLNYEESQLIPLTRVSWLTGDDQVVPVVEHFEVSTPPSFLRFLGSSPGTIYSHTITVTVTVLPRIVASMVPVIELLTKLFSKLFGLKIVQEAPVPETPAEEGTA